MKLKLSGLVSLIAMAVPGLVLANSFMSPWGAMNEFGPWDSEDIAGQRQQAQPRYPTRPMRSPRQLQKFNRPINRASVDIDARLSEVPVFVKKVNGLVNYDLGIRALTPEYKSLSVFAYPAKITPSPDNRQLELTCEIESMRRWDRDSTRGWGVRVVATFHDKHAEKLLEKATTVVISHGVCQPTIEKRGQLATQGIYEYHAAFVSRFEDTDQTGVMMEIGTGLRFNTGGNGYFERSRLEMAFTAVNDRDKARIKLK